VRSLLGRGQSRRHPYPAAAWSPILAEMETQMDTGPRHNQSQDELLASYEVGVWIFLGVVGLALFGIIVWIGLLVL
jgi:hypothetical protein